MNIPRYWEKKEVTFDIDGMEAICNIWGHSDGDPEAARQMIEEKIPKTEEAIRLAWSKSNVTKTRVNRGHGSWGDYYHVDAIREQRMEEFSQDGVEGLRCLERRQVAGPGDDLVTADVGDGGGEGGAVGGGCLLVEFSDDDEGRRADRRQVAANVMVGEQVDGGAQARLGDTGHRRDGGRIAGPREPRCADRPHHCRCDVGDGRAAVEGSEAGRDPAVTGGRPVEAEGRAGVDQGEAPHPPGMAERL